MSSCLRVFVFSCLAVAAAQAGGAQTPAAASNAQNGRELFVKYSCYACHGYDGHGGAGARLVPLPMTVDRFTAYVRSPRTPQMPSYSSKVLTDAQLADIWAHVKSMPASRSAGDIPLLARIMSGK